MKRTFNLYYSVIPSSERNGGHYSEKYSELRFASFIGCVNRPLVSPLPWGFSHEYFGLYFRRSYHFYVKSRKIVREYNLEKKPFADMSKRIWRVKSWELRDEFLVKTSPPVNATDHNKFLIRYENLEHLAHLIWIIKKDKSFFLPNRRDSWAQDSEKFLVNKPGIYLIQNSITKKKYVGKSSNLMARLKNYCDVSYIEHHRNSSKIFRAIIKFGLQNFSFTVLENCDEKVLSSREQHFINVIKPQYNIRKSVLKKPIS